MLALRLVSVYTLFGFIGCLIGYASPENKSDMCKDKQLFFRARHMSKRF